ncbi:MAG: DHH family phosphoesterase, partial [Firmicutes bacterium]|nr:DHH family phosphoesterase [Bacillota bacterium]
MAKWVLKRNKAYIEKIAEAFSLSPVTANVIANRHLGTAKEIEKYLYCRKEELYDAMEMKDMAKGLDIICDAIKNGRKIVVYGDYDVDGVMSTVILYKSLVLLGAECMFYLPHRQKEGYGMNMDAVEELHQGGAEVILACDNGIAAIHEVERAKELGMDVVIIDHHEPAFETLTDGTKKDIIPVADAVIDCKQEKCTYPFKMLCAAGMCYKFSGLLFEKMGREFDCDDEFITFAAIATVCDVVDLLDENRIIAKNGLALAQQSKNIGMQALLRQTNLDGPVNEYHAGFV